MTRDNEVTIDRLYGAYECHSCDNRSFSSEMSLLQHCRSNVHKWEWCERCQWLFVSSDARESHWRASDQHWRCFLCDEDFHTPYEMKSHAARIHGWCVDCRDRIFTDYVAHRIKCHHRCEDCAKEFETENNLRMVSLSLSLPLSCANVALSTSTVKFICLLQSPCLGCQRRFITDSALLIHLESGNCSSGVNCDDVDRWAFQCYQHRYFTNDWQDQLRYRCPGCESDFPYVSSLLQHTESPACAAHNANPVKKLVNWIFVRLASLT